MSKSKDNLIPKDHHAFLVIGDLTTTWPVIKEVIESEFLSGKEISSCPDVWLSDNQNAGIDFSRDLKNFSNYKPLSLSEKILIARLNFITKEAQNSLLKTLEEPLGESKIFILASGKDIFLPTVLSRLYEIKLDGMISEKGSSFAKKFVASTPAGRFKMLEKEFSGQRHEDKELVLRLLAEVENIFTGMKPADKEKAIKSGWDRLPDVRQMLFTDHGSPKQAGDLLSSILG